MEGQGVKNYEWEEWEGFACSNPFSGLGGVGGLGVEEWRSVAVRGEWEEWRSGRSRSESSGARGTRDLARSNREVSKPSGHLGSLLLVELCPSANAYKMDLEATGNVQLRGNGSCLGSNFTLSSDVVSK